MSPIFEVDFTQVHANTPVYRKGLYEVSTGEKVTGACWDKEGDDGETETVACVRIRPTMVGVYDAKGKLESTLDKVDIRGEAVENIDLYIHNKGGREFAKRVMMAILGYDKKDEKKFDEFVKTLDLSFEPEKSEDGKYTVEVGEGWQVLAGKNLKVALSKGTRKTREGVDLEVQKFNGYFPVGG